MPQIQLPIFPNGVTYITPELAVKKKDGRVTYFNGHMPVFIHDEKDIKSFRMITSQFCATGAAKQVEINKTFGIPIITVKRGVKLYREKGPGGFFEAAKSRGGKLVLTPSKLGSAQELLDKGKDLGAVSKELGVKKDTLRKALEDGRLKKNPQKNLRKSRL